VRHPLDLLDVPLPKSLQEAILLIQPDGMDENIGEVIDCLHDGHVDVEE